jgi:hypothetical protein
MTSCGSLEVAGYSGRFPKLAHPCTLTRLAEQRVLDWIRLSRKTHRRVMFPTTLHGVITGATSDACDRLSELAF